MKTIIFHIQFFPTVTTACSSIIRAPDQYLTLPTRPNNYHRNIDCEQVIMFEEGQRITLEFLSFHLKDRTVENGCR